MLRKWDIDKTKERTCVNEVITAIEEATDEEIGVIAAQDIIDTVLEHYAPEIYNAGVRDTQKLVRQKFDALDSEIGILEVSQ